MTLAAANKIIVDFHKYSEVCARLGAKQSVEMITTYVRALDTLTDYYETLRKHPKGLFDDAAINELDTSVHPAAPRSLAIAEKGD